MMPIAEGGMLLLLIICAATSATKTSKIRDAKYYSTKTDAVGDAPCGCVGSECWYCPGEIEVCYICADGIHCCYDNTPLCCLEQGVCCESGTICCTSENCCADGETCCSETSSCCAEDTPNCCKEADHCCPNDKPVCCDNSSNCCEKDTVCCGDSCCTEEQKCCTDADDKKYCCAKEVDCCGPDVCCTTSTECCGELIDNEGQTKNVCLAYEKVEEAMLGDPSSFGENGRLDILAVGVQQGDCTIISCPDSESIMIVDMGSVTNTFINAQYVNTLLKTINPSKIYILVTHPDLDHYNMIKPGLEGLTDKVQALILGGAFVDYPQPFKNYIEETFPNKIYRINDGQPCFGKKCVVHHYQDKQKIVDMYTICGTLSEVWFNIMASNLGSTKNSKSTVLQVKYGESTILLPGDFETQTAQDAIVAYYKDTPMGVSLESTFYKVAHHGASLQANCPNFIEAVNPQMASFVSQAYPTDSTCHHPRCDTVKRIQDVMWPEGKAVEGKVADKTVISPFPCWTADKLVDVKNFCLPIYATCREPGMQCQNIYISMGKFGGSTIEYWSGVTVDDEAAFDDSDDCDEFDDDIQLGIADNCRINEKATVNTHEEL